MPTGSEMGEALKRMVGATNTTKNRATIRAAADALIRQDERVAELERRLAQVIDASAEGDDLTLVAKGGEKLRVKASLARAASEVLDAALDFGADVAGTMKEETFDVHITVLRFIVAGIHPQDAKVIEEIINFSGNFLGITWLAQAAVQRALESADAAMLADLLLAAEGYVQLAREDAVMSFDIRKMWEEL